MTPRLRSTSAILVAFAVPLGVYVASLRGDLSFWDTGDLQTVPYILGIPYPTGFPGFVLVGWLWSHLEPFGGVAMRMNALTGVASAATVAALAATVLELDGAVPVALAAAGVFALAKLPWNHATYVDVHPVSFAAVAWAVCFALRWQRDGRARDAGLTLAAVTVALALDNTTLLAVPGIALLALQRRPPGVAALRAFGLAALALAAVYAYLPIRSAIVTAEARDPTLALGLAPGRPFWDDGHPSTWPTFVNVVTGAHFTPQHAALTMLGPEAFRRLITDFAPAVQHDLGIPVLLFALFGAMLWWWRAPFVLAALLVLAVVPLLFIFAYPAESDPTRYYLAAYFVTMLLAAYGVQALAALPDAPRMAASVAGAIVVALVLFADVRDQVDLFSQPTDPGASQWVDRVKRLTRDDAVVIAPWVYATPLGYAAYVERRLGHRIVVTAGAHDYEAHFRRWLATRTIVVVSDDPVTFRSFRTHQLDTDVPHVYALR